MGSGSIFHWVIISVILGYALGEILVRTLASRVPPISRASFLATYLGITAMGALLMNLGIDKLIVILVSWLIFPILGIGRAKDAGRGLVLAKIMNIPVVGFVSAIILLFHPPVGLSTANEESTWANSGSASTKHAK